MKKISLYCRVSSEKQEKEGTIQSQIEALEKYSKEKEFIIIDKYIDDGWSGTLLARPELDRLRDDASKGLFDAVLIHSPDRLARKYVYQEIVIEELKKKEVEVIFHNRPITKTIEDQLLLGVQGIVADYERMKIKERTRRGKLFKARSGHVIGSKPPYGYIYVKKTANKPGYYKINKNQAKVIKLIFKLITDKKISVRKLVKELHNRRIKSPKGNKFWAQSSLKRILANTTYIGITYYNKCKSVESPNKKNKYSRTKNSSNRLRPKKEWIPIKVPAIINKDLFDRARRQIKNNFKLSPKSLKFQYLLRGILFCEECKHLFYSCPSHGKRNYRCSNRFRTYPLKANCSSPTIPADKIEDLTWNTICELLNQPSIIKKQVKRYTEHKTKTNSKTIKLSDARKSLKSNIDQQNRLLEAYKHKIISLKQLQKEIDPLKEEQVNLEAKIEDINKNNIEAVPRSFINQSIKKHSTKLKKVLNSLDFEKKRWIVESLLEKIVFSKEKINFHGYIPINKCKTTAMSSGRLGDSLTIRFRVKRSI